MKRSRSSCSLPNVPTDSKRLLRSNSSSCSLNERLTQSTSHFNKSFGDPGPSYFQDPYKDEWMDTRHKQKFSNKPGFICLYDVSEHVTSPQRMPAYIKNKEPNAPILEVLLPLNNNRVFKSPVLDDNQNKRLNCFAECVEEMLGGLQIDNSSHTSKWYEPDKTRDQCSRSEKVMDIVKSYQFGTVPDFECRLIHIYTAFIGGFTNAVARKALEQIFLCCRTILDKRRVDFNTHNVGGNSYFEGNSHILPIYHDLSSLTGVQLITTVKEQFKAAEGNDHAWVPDCVMFNSDKKSGEFRDFYFFGECKTGSVSALNLEMMKQLWHQSLQGLLSLDSVYGCGISASFVGLLRLDKIETKVVTSLCTVEFRLPVEESMYFSVEGFMQFIKILTRVIQENSTDE